MHHPVRPRKRALSILLALAMCVALVPVGSAGAVITPTTWYVDVLNGSDSNGGTSATDAFEHIQTALNEGDWYDTVILLPGTYDDNAEDWPVNITYAVTIKSQGGADVTFVGDEGGHALFDVTAGPTHIEGLTFQNGLSQGGGAILAWGATLEVKDCAFTGNTAGMGGAIYFDSGIQVGSLGADSVAGSLSLDGCEFVANGNETTDTPLSAKGAAPICNDGGAVYARGSTVNIESSLFQDNGAEYVGPAVFLESCNAWVADTVFDGTRSRCGPMTNWTHLPNRSQRIRSQRSRPLFDRSGSMGMAERSRPCTRRFRSMARHSPITSRTTVREWR